MHLCNLDALFFLQPSFCWVHFLVYHCRKFKCDPCSECVSTKPITNSVNFPTWLHLRLKNPRFIFFIFHFWIGNSTMRLLFLLRSIKIIIILNFLTLTYKITQHKMKIIQYPPNCIWNSKDHIFRFFIFQFMDWKFQQVALIFGFDYDKKTDIFQFFLQNPPISIKKKLKIKWNPIIKQKSPRI